MSKPGYNANRPQEIKDFFEKARAVLDKEEEGREVLEDPEESKKKLYKKKYPLIILPTVNAYASKIGYTSRALRNWRDKHPEFDEAVRCCADIQKDMLIQMSLNNHYNQSIVRLILFNNHGWTDKAEVTSKGAVNLHFDSQDEDA
jgi:hypothetical protein